MSRSIVAGLKLGGVFSLGLLTGVHLNFSIATIKSILSLASAPQAQKAFITALGSLRATVRPLETLTTTCLLTAFALSPRHGKHPYLLLCAATPLICTAIEKLKLSGVEYGIRSIETNGDRRGTGAEVGINGEVVCGKLEDWRTWGLFRGGLMGAGFGMGLLGIWGDGV